MFDDLLSMLEQRVSEQRLELFREALNRLYFDFKFESLDEFATNLVIGSDDLYPTTELDIIVTNGCIELYRQQLLRFGVRLNPSYVTLDSFRSIHDLCLSIFECEFQDDTDRLMALINDEDMNAIELLAAITQHIRGINANTIMPLIAYVQPDLILQMQKVLANKYTKETAVEEMIHIPEYIRLRLQAFQGTYGGVFFDYVNSGGAVGVPFESLISISTEQLAPVREKPYEFTWELIFFALASTMPNQDVIPTVKQLVTLNFPTMEDNKLAQSALNEFLTSYGDTLK